MAGHAVFINYRRDDTADACGRIYDRLVHEFTPKAVFKDVDALPVGHDFGTYIVETLQECRVLLAVIGPGWLNVTDHAGGRRIDDPKDWVRLEIETAAQTPGLQIVPILLNGATMPRASDLPESLAFLSALNAAVVRRDPDFHTDMDRLIAALKEGALTGFVQVAKSGQGVAAAHWNQIKDSDDVPDLRRFAESFPGTTEGLEARRRADLLDVQNSDFAHVHWQSTRSIDSFLEKWPEHPRKDEALEMRANALVREQQECDTLYLNLDQSNENDVGNFISRFPHHQRTPELIQRRDGLQKQRLRRHAEEREQSEKERRREDEQRKWGRISWLGPFIFYPAVIALAALNLETGRLLYALLALFPAWFAGLLVGHVLRAIGVFPVSGMNALPTYLLATLALIVFGLILVPNVPLPPGM